MSARRTCGRAPESRANASPAPPPPRSLYANPANNSALPTSAPTDFFDATPYGLAAVTFQANTPCTPPDSAPDSGIWQLPVPWAAPSAYAAGSPGFTWTDFSYSKSSYAPLPLTTFADAAPGFMTCTNSEDMFVNWIWDWFNSGTGNGDGPLQLASCDGLVADISPSSEDPVVVACGGGVAGGTPNPWCLNGGEGNPYAPMTADEAKQWRCKVALPMWMNSFAPISYVHGATCSSFNFFDESTLQCVDMSTVAPGVSPACTPGDEVCSILTKAKAATSNFYASYRE